MTTAKEISDEFEVGRALGQIAEAQARRGDTAGAVATASRMKDTDGWYKVSAYEKIARAQAKTGDAVGARKSLEAAKAVAASEPNESNKASHLHAVASTQAEVGEISDAKATTAQISDKYEQSHAYTGIAAEQAKAGDRAGAHQTIELAKTSAAQLTDGNTKGDAYRSVAREQAIAGEIDAVRETAAKINDKMDQHYAYYDIVLAQLEAKGCLIPVRPIARPGQRTPNAYTGAFFRAVRQHERQSAQRHGAGGNPQVCADLRPLGAIRRERLTGC